PTEVLTEQPDTFAAVQKATNSRPQECCSCAPRTLVAHNSQPSCCPAGPRCRPPSPLWAPSPSRTWNQTWPRFCKRWTAASTPPILTARRSSTCVESVTPSKRTSPTSWPSGTHRPRSPSPRNEVEADHDQLRQT